MASVLSQYATLLCCPSCRGLLAADVSGECFQCRECNSCFKTINSVPSFVAEELTYFSEVPVAERANFLAMKQITYAGNGIVSRMYNHYHRFAAESRCVYGGDGLTADIGCGIGEGVRFLPTESIVSGTFVGIDVDRFKLEICAKRYPDIPVIQANAYRLPFANGSVIAVQLLAILEHFPPDDIGAILEESLRILKPGGILIVCYPSEGGLLLRLCQQVMHPFLKWRSGFDLDQGAVHRHLTGAADIQAQLGQRKDLELLESWFYPFGVRSVNLSLFVNQVYRKR